jgi:23S rRNA maturation-related 3'-5' exoribonuclease YhaM
MMVIKISMKFYYTKWNGWVLRSKHYSLFSGLIRHTVKYVTVASEVSVNYKSAVAG